MIERLTIKLMREGWMNGCTNERMDGWINECMRVNKRPVCSVLTVFFKSATTPLPNPNRPKASPGEGGPFSHA